MMKMLEKEPSFAIKEYCMKLIEKLYEMNIKPIEIKNLSFDYKHSNTSLQYVIYKKHYENQEISRYYIFDVDTFNNENNPIINIDMFECFQEALLSKIYFNSSINIKYNLYIIFSFPNNYIIDERYQRSISIIENNLSFARKVFFKYDDLYDYFNYYTQLEKATYSYEYDLKKIDTIKKCIRLLDKYKLKSCLTTSINKKTRSAFLRSIVYPDNTETNYDHIINHNSLTCEEFFNQYYQLDNNDNKKDYRLYHIEKVINKNFRKSVLKNNVEDLKLFNLLCGKNATGKTSFLDLIELTLTGKIHRTNEELFQTETMIVGSNGTEFKPIETLKNETAIKNIWYKGKVGTLNDLFCRINYFDIDAAYRFALQYSNSSYQRFLCDYKLLETKNNLHSHLNILTNHSGEISHIYNAFISECYKNDIDTIYNNNKQPNSNVNINKEKIFRTILSPKLVDTYISLINKCINLIDNLLEEEISNNINTINLIYKKLDSINYNILYSEPTKKIMIENVLSGNCVEIERISTAQRVCFALSIIFSQFFSITNAPKFILLDESVANFDSLHLLNLCDFLRELAINNIQIVFTTANSNIANSAQNKFIFLEDNFKKIQIDEESYNIF